MDASDRDEEIQILEFLDSYNIKPDLSIADEVAAMGAGITPQEPLQRSMVTVSSLIENMVAEFNIEFMFTHSGFPGRAVNPDILCPINGLTDIGSTAKAPLQRGVLQVRDGQVRFSLNDFDFVSRFVASSPAPRGGILAPFPARKLAQPLPSIEFSQKFPQWAHLYAQVIAAGRPNYAGAQIPIPNSLNVMAWEKYLAN